MEPGDWISIFMALIAIISSAIAYTVYRSSTDPNVIVYADPDPRRPSVINLIIKNVGSGPAIDITFDSDRPLPMRAFSIEIPKKMPEEMTDGPIIVGVPYLAPGQQLIVTWGQFGGLKKFIGNKPICVTANFLRGSSFIPSHKFLSSRCKLDIESFGNTDSSDFNWGPKVVNQLENANKQLMEISSSVKKISERS